ncbi:4Fe-4S binding domain protein [uncultured Desulfobacterium sp.]|uniref:4Fe-4S binding domain protein n=1 Tax=uncultured Desulfobacterium sp. TaxID=201089 RepID=A0A445MT54_9BACT|nr:4Fe-4S binding domain protein [uncultured Desulfobacterium sp.]
MVRLVVNDLEIEAEDGISVLEACLNNGIYIPNLCFINGMSSPPVSCRMCFVEIEGEARPVSSCAVKATDGMKVRTDTEQVRGLQRTAFQLLMSVHDVDCGRCPANKRCPLQRIAVFLKVPLRPGRLEKHLKNPDVDNVHPLIDYYPNRCMLCGKCIFVCREKHGQPRMTFAKRGFETVISFYGEKDLSGPACKECLACIDICPVRAIVTKDQAVE